MTYLDSCIITVACVYVAYAVFLIIYEMSRHK